MSLGNRAGYADGIMSSQPRERIKATLRLLKFYQRFLASDYELAEDPVRGWSSELTRPQAALDLRKLVNLAINRKAGDVAQGRGDFYATDLDIALRRDAQRVRDWVERRIALRGSGFQSKHFRKRLGYMEGYWRIED